MEMEKMIENITTHLNKPDESDLKKIEANVPDKIIENNYKLFNVVVKLKEKEQVGSGSNVMIFHINYKQ